MNEVRCGGFVDLSFGALFRALRIRNEETLRQYCIKRGFDVGNISKLERNLLSPPLTKRQMKRYLSGLKYNRLDYDFLVTAAFNYQIGKAAKNLGLR